MDWVTIKPRQFHSTRFYVDFDNLLEEYHLSVVFQNIQNPNKCLAYWISFTYIINYIQYDFYCVGGNVIS